MHTQISCIGNVHQWPHFHLQVSNRQQAMDNRQCRPWGFVVKQHVWQTLVVVEVRACTATAHKTHICNCLWYQVGWYELLVGSVNLSMYWGQHQHMQLNVIVINQHDMTFPSSLSKGFLQYLKELADECHFPGSPNCCQWITPASGVHSVQFPKVRAQGPKLKCMKLKLLS